ERLEGLFQVLDIDLGAVEADLLRLRFDRGRRRTRKGPARQHQTGKSQRDFHMPLRESVNRATSPTNAKRAHGVAELARVPFQPAPRNSGEFRYQLREPAGPRPRACIGYRRNAIYELQD